MVKIGILVQAHMGSTRLPNKMMMNLCGKSVLGHVISRLQRVERADELIIAISDLTADDILAEECQRYNVKFYRGNDSDVLGRFYEAASFYRLTDIVRVCADNTLTDWNIIDEEIKIYMTGRHDVVTAGETIPLGLGAEVFSYKSLSLAHERGTEHYHREHVTPYLYEYFENIFRYDINEDYSKYRFTLDTWKDWELIEKIYKTLYRKGRDIELEDVISTMEMHPEWYLINKDVKQKNIKE